jgi:hypothetical protein
MTAARADGYDRPWARAVRSTIDTESTRPNAARPPSRDATPREDDLEPGD